MYTDYETICRSYDERLGLEDLHILFAVKGWELINHIEYIFAGIHYQICLFGII